MQYGPFDEASSTFDKREKIECTLKERQELIEVNSARGRTFPRISCESFRDPYSTPGREEEDDVMFERRSGGDGFTAR